MAYCSMSPLDIHTLTIYGEGGQKVFDSPRWRLCKCTSSRRSSPVGTLLLGLRYFENKDDQDFYHGLQVLAAIPAADELVAPEHRM